MDYFFDESGNWQEPGRERRRLLIGGLLFGDPDLERSLGRELDIFMARENLEQLHATDLTPARRERCYRLVLEHLGEESRVLVRSWPPSILRSRSRSDADEVYLERAAALARVMLLGDPQARIYYDLKFYYAYPLNVVKQVGKLPWYLKRARDRFVVNPRELARERDRLLERLEREREKVGRGRPGLEEFVAGLVGGVEGDPLESGFDERVVELRRRIGERVADYYWSELWQQFRGQDRMRERFRERILSELARVRDRLGMEDEPPSLEIHFLGKQENRPGILAVDLICNLVYRLRETDAEALSPAERGILDRIELEEHDR